MKTSLQLVVVLALSVISALPHAAAQGYPSKPIRLIVPYAPGGGSDNNARPLAQQLTQVMGQQVIIDNRGGAGATIGATLASNAQPDGYTLLLCSVGTHATGPQIRDKVPYDPAKDLVPIVLISTSPTLLVVHNKLPIENLKDFVQFAKAKPGKLTYASGGSGSGSHLAAEVFKTMAGIDLLHVPFKGGGESNPAIMAGSVDVKFDAAVSIMPYVSTGRVKGVAIGRESRWPDLPNVQTFAEAGWPQFKMYTWYGLCAPRQTPKAIIEKINADAQKALAAPEYQKILRRMVADPVGGPPQQFAEWIRAEYDFYGKIIRELHLRGK